MKSFTTKNGNIIYYIARGRSNVLLLTNGKNNILIDTSRTGYRESIFRNLATLGVTKLDALFLTHTHFDHAENASLIKKEFGAKVIVNKLEENNLKNGSNPPIEGTILPSKIIVSLFGKFVLKRMKYEPCEADFTFEEKFDMADFGFNAYLLHTPGHTPGSSSIIIDDDIAIVGDAMFGIFPNSIFPPYGENPVQLIKSWGKLLETNCRLFIPAHGSPNSRSLVQKCYEKKMRKLKL